ncbi:MAG: hypothetical protein AAFW65_01360 [Pseudomonadota bacterium]
MPADLFMKLGAYGAIFGGALRIVASFVPFTPESAALEVFYALIDFSLMAGLAALYVANATRLGTVGLVGFVLAFAGLASIIGPDPAMLGIDFYQLGVAVIGLGVALLGLRIVVLDGLRMPGGFWLSAFVAGLAAYAGAGAVAFVVAGILFGAGFIAAGVALLRRSHPRRLGDIDHV